MLSNAFRQIIDGAIDQWPRSRRLSAVRWKLNRKKYPELGVRSFGRGTFHKPALDGSKLRGGSTAIMLQHPAWEGACCWA